MIDIFISYARGDRARAQMLAAELEQEGYCIWWDPKIPPGKTFDEVIEEALDEAKCIVVLWSKNSIKSDWVRTEASEAKRRKIFVPVLIEDVTIPLEFRRIQSADLKDWENSKIHSGYTALLGAISGIVGSPSGKDLEEVASDATGEVSLDPGIDKKNELMNNSAIHQRTGTSFSIATSSDSRQLLEQVPQFMDSGLVSLEKRKSSFLKRVKLLLLLVSPVIAYWILFVIYAFVLEGIGTNILSLFDIH